MTFEGKVAYYNSHMRKNFGEISVKVNQILDKYEIMQIL
jgi:hypothetical protein